MRVKSTCSKCNNTLEPSRLGKYAYCMTCHAGWMRANRTGYSDLTPEQKKKDCARSYLGVYVRRGTIQKGACSKCGNPKAEGHHENYDNPLEVIWLCRQCHLELHHVARETNMSPIKINQYAQKQLNRTRRSEEIPTTTVSRTG